MAPRRIARELAVIIMPQIGRDKKRLERLEFDTLLCRSVQILTDHARHCLSEAGSYLTKAHKELGEIEINHPDNARKIADVRPVNIKTDELKQQLELIETSIHLISEALDIPEMAVSSDYLPAKVNCDNCGTEQKLHLKRPASADLKHFVEQLIGTYLENRERVDHIINSIKTKWRMDRMVSIDRDILRLACTEAFFIPDIPVKVAISEAVELAHRFADDRAAKFINGVLADLAEDAEQFRLTGEFKLAEPDKDSDESDKSTAVGR